MTFSDLEKHQKVKARFMKRAIEASKKVPRRMVYMLARETFFSEDIRLKMPLQAIEPYNVVISRRKQKERERDRQQLLRNRRHCKQRVDQ